MGEISLRQALERRYDGPFPAEPACAADWNRPWDRQIASRKDLAWAEVRRHARDMVAARRAFRASRALAHHRAWARARARLHYALGVWAGYRDWLNDPDGGAD